MGTDLPKVITFQKSLKLLFFKRGQVFLSFAYLIRCLHSFFTRVPFAGMESWLRKSSFLLNYVEAKRSPVLLKFASSREKKKLSQQQRLLYKHAEFAETCVCNLESCRPASHRHWPVGNSVQIFPDAPGAQLCSASLFVLLLEGLRTSDIKVEISDSALRDKRVEKSGIEFFSFSNL